ncbi:hypothetical protein [Bacillus niameyensis]|nr:hypothetical protein [Bacillus niameyensis]
MLNRREYDTGEFKFVINKAKKPSAKCLTVDTSQPIEMYIEEVVNYIQS